MNNRTFLCGLLPVLVFVIMSFQIKAQEKHFIYIQSENKQPFYVQVNNQTYNSTISGYIIIPQLISNKYYLLAGFAKNLYPEQKFIVDLSKDAGYSLKQFDDKKWGLLNIVSLNTIMADSGDSIAKTQDLALSQPVQKDTIASVAPVNDTVSKPADLSGLLANKATVLPSPPLKNDTLAIVAMDTIAQSQRVKNSSVQEKEVIVKPVVNESPLPVLTDGSVAEFQQPPIRCWRPQSRGRIQ